MHHEQVTLGNHLQTLFINAPGNTAGSVQIWFRAGSALEEKNDHGIAHFLEHMFFKGTEKRPGAAIAHEVESFGGEINAFTSFDYTCYYINSPVDHIPNTVEILLDMVSNPRFLEEDIVPERGVVFEEYRRSLDNPGQFAFHQLQKSTFTGGYAHPILGNEKTIKNFSQDQLWNFRKNFYNLKNALFVVAGDLREKSKIVKTIESFQLPDGPQTQFPEFKLKNSPTVNVHSKDTSMGQLNVCIQSPSETHSASPAEDLALNCLGHGESSLLYQSLVIEDSLSNHCGTSTMFMNNGGLHFLRFNFPVDNFKKLLKKVEQVLLNIYINGFEDDDVTKIKNQYVASKIFDMESIESYAFSLGHSFASSGDIRGEEEFISRIKNTSTLEVNKALREVFKRPLHLSLQLPSGENLSSYEKLLSSFEKSLQQKISKAKPKMKYNFKVKKSFFDPQVQLLQIKPGVQLLYRENKLNPTFVLHAYIKGGITEETAQTNGLYNLVSGVLTKGYQGMDYTTLKTQLDMVSASFSSFSGKNAYGLTLHGQSEHFKKLVRYFNETLARPSFKANFVKHEKELTLRNIKNSEKDPIKNCFQKASEILFHGHPYSLPVSGTKESLRKISGKLIRETHEKNLRNKEILFTYCGDASLEEVLDQMSDFFNELKPRKERKLVKKKVTPQKGQKTHIHFEREQTQIFTGIPTQPLGHKDNVALKMITTHLSGQSSELFVEVRDRQGLCYTAQPVHFSAMEAGYWGIYMASGHDKVEAALKAISQILQNIKENGIGEKNFNRVKEMIQGQSLLNVQTNDDYANIYSVTTLQGKGLDYYHLSNKEVAELTYKDFLVTIKKLFNQKWSTVLVGKEAPPEFHY